MSLVYVTSDWHFGHKNVHRFRDEFKSEEQHREFILARYRAVVRPRDTVWFLGDIVFDPDHLQAIKDLPGTKHLVLGNHDTERKVDVAQLCLVFDDIHGLVSYKHHWLSHAPVHPDELRGRYNVHGHVHSQTLKDPRYFNACLENTDYNPKLFDRIRAELIEANRKDYVE